MLKTGLFLSPSVINVLGRWLLKTFNNIWSEEHLGAAMPRLCEDNWGALNEACGVSQLVYILLFPRLPGDKLPLKQCKVHVSVFACAVLLYLNQ